MKLSQPPSDIKNYATLYIVRHGEAEGNVKRIMMGYSTDLPLTPNGEVQAQTLSKKLEKIKFDAVFSSDTLRAKRTAELIALEKKLAIQTSNLIRERSYGIHEGKPHEEYNRATTATREMLKKLSEEEHLTFHFPDNIENDTSLLERFMTFVREVAVAYVGKTVLIVTHGGTMRNFLIHTGFIKRQELGNISNTAYFKLLSDGVDFFITETDSIEENI